MEVKIFLRKVKFGDRVLLLVFWTNINRLSARNVQTNVSNYVTDARAVQTYTIIFNKSIVEWTVALLHSLSVKPSLAHCMRKNDHPKHNSPCSSPGDHQGPPGDHQAQCRAETSGPRSATVQQLSLPFRRALSLSCERCYSQWQCSCSS